VKAKTKRKIHHTLTKKKLVSKKTSRLVLRSSLIFGATICTGALAYAAAVVHPTINVAVSTAGPNGKVISAPATPVPTKAPGSPDQTGRGSWYALGLPAPDTLTCASRTFPRGSYLEVKDLYNGNTVTCRVNDYGPEIWTGRVIDLSRGSFRVVDNLGRGTIPVEIRLVTGPSGLTIPLGGNISDILGYQLCRQNHDGGFCENHRKD
jgi:rare lipoprotein A (peptidoglycan hydrolase)